MPQPRLMPISADMSTGLGLRIAEMIDDTQNLLGFPWSFTLSHRIISQT